MSCVVSRFGLAGSEFPSLGMEIRPELADLETRDGPGSVKNSFQSVVPLFLASSSSPKV